MTEVVDVVVVGAGAAGLMCAATAGYRGRRVLVLDHANKAGKKILMSGGGRCNFTHLNSTPANFLSANPAFCISALKRYTPQDFLELVERHGVSWCEKSPGQLFCTDSSKEILRVLLTECDYAGVEVRLNTSIKGVRRAECGFVVDTSHGEVRAQSLVVACGGLSIPTMGATGFGYELARQFGLEVLPVRAGLVPFTLQPADKQLLEPLSGLSTDVAITAGAARFREALLVTHRGISGPAVLQVSSYWSPGEQLTIDWLPGETDVQGALRSCRESHPRQSLEQWLSRKLPQRLAQVLCSWRGWSGPLQHFSNARLAEVAQELAQWKIKPSGTEGYRTAEVTLGGVDTRQLCQRTMQVRDVPGLFFIGEVVDVTGQLGGHNFQWAWASGWCAGQAV